MCPPEKKQLHIHLDRMLEIMGLGVRRASSFMALGVRVSNDETVASVALDGNFQIQFMADLTVEQVRDVQRNFRVWIVGNGLRELDQAASLFADSVFKGLTLARFHEQRLPQAALDRIEAFKKKTNVADKFASIADEFGIDTNFRVHMPGLSKARNALTHNMGIVGPLHCTYPDELRLSWIGFEFEVGDQVIAADFEPLRLEKDQLVRVGPGPRNRIIPVNRPIELSPHDLNEICLTYWWHAQKLIGEAGRVLKQWGIGPADPVP